MKMTFIADHGIWERSAQVGADDYEHANEFKAAVKAELAKQWDNDSAAGYEDIIAADSAKLDQFAASSRAEGGVWVEYLRVPYGYLVLTK
jgi:hypothetical protein